MRKLLITGTIVLVTGCSSGIKIETNTPPGVDFNAYRHTGGENERTTAPPVR